MVMMEMQDTINELQQELSALGKSAKQSKSRLSSARGSAVGDLFGVGSPPYLHANLASARELPQGHVIYIKIELCKPLQ